jgi:hypothetical protein
MKRAVSLDNALAALTEPSFDREPVGAVIHHSLSTFIVATITIL